MDNTVTIVFKPGATNYDSCIRIPGHLNATQVIWALTKHADELAAGIHEYLDKNGYDRDQEDLVQIVIGELTIGELI